jgi:hypothetical protein
MELIVMSKSFDIKKAFLILNFIVNLNGIVLTAADVAIDSPNLLGVDRQLYIAIMTGNFLAANGAIKKGANVNVRYNQLIPSIDGGHKIRGGTILHSLLVLGLTPYRDCGSPDILYQGVRLLIQNGADPNIEDLEGVSALSLANIYLALASDKKSAYWRGESEKTAITRTIQILKEPAFFAAVYANRIDLVKDFLVSGIDINVKDKDGNTALMIAEKNRNGEFVDFLLKSGAICDVGNPIAREKGHVEAINFALEALKDDKYSG